MKISEIRNTCIKASNVYYEYLENNRKGVYNINVRGIKKVGKSRIKLNINGSIFDEETLVFKHIPSNTEYTVESIKIQVYDRDTNTIVLKVKPEIYPKFINANANVNDWIIVSDMKFLIDRVKEWYETNGNDIAIPVKASSLKTPSSDIFFDNEKPSKEQLDALDIIFNKPLTYIWGAPGTGKTQFVLSYAILHYIANNKKVAIVAPTNHALEQIYRGVIKMTDKAGINRDSILRLGGPSKKFADEFPEVCEIIGLENQLLQINAQIDIIKQILGIDEASNEQQKLEKGLDSINRIQSLISRINTIQGTCDENTIEINELESENRKKQLLLDSIKKEKLSLEKKRDSAFYAFTSIFTKKIDFKNKINQLITEQVQIEKTIENVLKIKNKLDSIADKSRVEIYKLNEDLKSKIQKFNFDFKILNFPKLTSQNLDEIQSIIINKIFKIVEDKPVYESLSEEYSHLDAVTLRLKYDTLLAEQNRLANYSTEERLKNVSIIGATLDTYLFRFREKKIGVDHIFLDEAGYSNIIKAMTLFNQKVPVTFLGDHMQLPPVCEISKRDIQSNQNFRSVMVWDQSAIYLEDLFKYDELDTIVSRYLNGSNADFESMVKSNLTGTFRFGNSLARVLKQHVYPEGFNSKKNEETEIIIYQVQNPSNRTNNSRLNISEVEAIQSLINTNFKEDSDVAVLAPYSAQVRALTNALPEFQRQNKVLTVHKSQGQEWDTVIYSVCDIGNGKRPWFTDSTNTMSSGLNNINTAISRAKKTLIIVCNPEEWKFFQDQLVTGIINVSTKIIKYNKN